MELHPDNVGFEWKDHQGPFRRLGAEEATGFDRDGFFVLRDALDRSRLAELTEVIDGFEAENEAWIREKHGGRYFISRADQITFTTHLVARDERVRAFSRTEPFLGLCHDLVGPDVRLYWDQAVYKKPEMPKDFPWHQDNGYVFIEPQAYLTCWVPLVDVDESNGCPWVWPGAHRFGTLAHRLSSLGYVCKEDDTEAVPVPAAAGDVVVFSSLTPHRTGPNLTDSVRKAYILQYAPDGARGKDGAAFDAQERQYRVLTGGQPETGSPV